MASRKHVRQPPQQGWANQLEAEEVKDEIILKTSLLGHALNQLLCMDFKGYFSTGDGARCDQFTITDAHSR